MKHIPVLLFLSLALAACTSASKSSENDDERGVAAALPEEQNTVTVETLQPSVFYHELLSNGKLTARRYVDLHFQSAEPVEFIWVKNGDRVAAGQRLAALSMFRLQTRTAQAKDALNRAHLDLQDVLIGQGFSPTDSAAIPQGIMELARTRSGYDQARTQYRLALYEEEHATLTAPFEGVVANLFAKPFGMASPSEVFCSVIGLDGMEASFGVLESELPLISKGDAAGVSAYSDGGKTVVGHISEINPVVDDGGMVRVKASVPSGDEWFVGMNVRISVRRSLPGRLVVPKTAVVLRSGKHVVFTLNDGKAYWNYVQLGLENAGSYTITDGLAAGDRIITSGNINLAHEAPVRVVGSLE
ncbi:MAG: efflux RND transporter periplasmic adaptor subunit [Tannerellaceae bacterium]|jgi:RND family efflux transporter MFP subunit|nr:efflux RND transporter periplasmic adaptor subunit [Tannerellaceae bacterium]